MNTTNTTAYLIISTYGFDNFCWYCKFRRAGFGMGECLARIRDFFQSDLRATRGLK